MVNHPQYTSLIHTLKTPYAERWVSDCYMLHQRLYNAFQEGDRPHVLFRVERTARRNTIVVQSSERPRWSSIFFRQPELLLDSPIGEPTAVSYRRKVGEELDFRVLANTIRQRPQGVVRLAPEEVPAWMEKKSERNGFRISCLTRVFRTTLRGSKPGGERMAFSCSLVEGRLVVADPELFAKLVVGGFGGHGLGFGVGLFSFSEPARFQKW